MKMLGKIKPKYLRDKLSLHKIAKRTGLSCNPLRPWFSAPEAVQAPV